MTTTRLIEELVKDLARNGDREVTLSIRVAAPVQQSRSVEATLSTITGARNPRLLLKGYE
jgi:hypothetical protein